MQTDFLQPAAGSAWFSVTDGLPQRDVVVETKIDDGWGCRNQTFLKLHGSLWFFPDMSMYVYHEPTHWRMPNAARPNPRRLQHDQAVILTEQSNGENRDPETQLPPTARMA